MAKDSSRGNYQGEGRDFTTGRLLEATRFHQSGSAGLGNDFNFGYQPVGLSSDKGAVQATSAGGNMTDVTFVENCIVEVAVAEICRRI